MNLKNVKFFKLHQRMCAFTLIIMMVLVSSVSSQCGQSCSTCSNSTVCTTCSSQNNIVLRNDSLYCVPCPSRCEKCSSQNYLNECITCSSGYYQDPFTKSCLPCNQPNCKQCNPYSPQQCIQCQQQYYLEQATTSCKYCNQSYPNSKTCRQNFINSCQEGYFTSNGLTCNKCSQNLTCKSCSSSTVCNQCFDGYFLSTGSRCSACDSTCRTCNTISSCTSCHKGFRINSLSKCQPCATPNCASCTIQDVCLQCTSNYYLDGQKKQCVLLPSNKTISACTRYSNNFNLTVSKSYQSNEILCRTCKNGTYVSFEINSCQSCSLLCQNCAGMYRSSKCVSCNKIFGKMTDPINGICGPKLFTSNNQKVFYFTNRNDGQKFIRSGKQIRFAQTWSRCPGGSLASQVSVDLSSAKGYQYQIYVKLLTYTLSQMPYEINIEFDSNLVKTIKLNTQNQTDASSQKCTNLTISNFSFSFTLQQISLKNSSYLNQNFSNILRFSALEDILIDVRQIVILVKSCHSSCQFCLKSNQCIKCKNPQQFLQSEKCVDICDSGYFFNQAKRQCVLQCPKGTYNQYKSILWTCEPCNSFCQTCIDQQICTSCKNGFYLFQKSCLTQCPNQFFENTLFNKCQKCSSPCQSCLSINQCTSCQIGFLYSQNNTCLNECPLTFYGDFQKMKCLKCQSPCQTCKSKTECLSCESISNLTYFKNLCIKECPEGYFAFKNEKGLMNCLVCSFPCLECKKFSSQCTKCKFGYLLDSNSTCIASCPNGYFNSKSSMSCLTCESPCKNCKNSQSQCTSCIQGYVYNQVQNSCLKVCNKGFYQDNTMLRCKPCPIQCKQCQNPLKCTNCNQNYYLQDSSCLQRCNDGFFKAINDSKNLCLKCAQNCLTCFGEPSYCLSCAKGNTLLTNNTCSSLCKATQLTPGCSKCDYPCYSCQRSVSNCTSCQNGFFLFQKNKQCVTDCYIGYYKIIQKGFGLCKPCPAPCSNCENQNFCHSCSSINSTTYYLQTLSANKRICVINCSLFEFKDNVQKICIKCTSPCLSCLNTTYCTVCDNGILINGNCFSKTQGCPIGTYQTLQTNALINLTQSSQKICLACPLKCSSCKSSTICTGCNLNFYLFGNTCVDFCPSGMAPIKNLRTCIYCSYPCAECQGSSSYCTQCNQIQLNSSSSFCPQERKMGNLCIKYFLLHGQCLSDCPPITFAKGDKCLSCVSPCLTCISESICSSCLDNYYMLEKKCYSNCPLGFYGQNLTKQCEKCKYPCKQCKSQRQCLTCIEGYLFEERCVVKDPCPTGYFESLSKKLGNICEKCDSQCIACKDSKSNCIQCNQKSVYEGRCLQICPNGFYSQKKASLFKTNFTVLSCEKCNAQCLTCKSLNQCVNCAYPQFSLDKKCVNRCPINYMERRSLFQFSSKVFYPVSKCSLCQSPCRSCFLEENLCETCIQNHYMYNKKCLLTCPDGTYLDNLSKSCKQCPFPCKSCVWKQGDIGCLQCIKGHYLQNQRCVDKCQESFIDLRGKECVQNCSGAFMVSHILTSERFCVQKCTFPYLKSINNVSCVTQCSSNEYVSSEYECKQITNDILSLIPMPKNHLFVNAKGILTIYIEMNRNIEFTGQIQLEKSLKIMFSKYSLTQNIRFLQSANTSTSSKVFSQTLPFKIIKKQPLYIVIQLYPNNSITYPGFISVQFQQNNHLKIVDKISRLPLGTSYMRVQLKENQSYEAYSYEDVDNRFEYIGEIVIDFVFILSIGLIIFNRYAKIYFLLNFSQSIFMLVCLDMKIPPNLFRFLQGFKYSHFYQIPNWIDRLQEYERYTDFSNKGFSRLESIFSDLNFIRVSGHLISLFIIVCGVFLIFYLTRFFPRFSNETYVKTLQFFANKIKLVKWSHLTDLFISTSMLILASFFFQTVDYSVEKTQQSIGIVLSYIFLVIFFSYGLFFCFKTYKMVKLSEREPQKFRRKQYLQRQEYISFFEGITTPQNIFKNYMLLVRILVYGVLTGLAWNYANLCLSIWIIFQICYAVVYFWHKPFALDSQNYLYGSVSVIYSISLALLIVVNQYQGSTLDQILSKQQVSESVLNTKLILGYFIIILIVICVFLLLIQMVISIIRGSFKPKKLVAEQENYHNLKQNSPNSLLINQFSSVPKKIAFQEKKELTGYTIKNFDQSSKNSLKFLAKQD